MINQPDLTPPLFTRGGRFIDPQGRHVILHGINLVNKDPAQGYLGGEGLAEFHALRRWGFNCLRLGVIWDGLEPEPGALNEAYLRGLDRQVEMARACDLYVVLDMHQDLFSALYADGAPAWATLTGGQPHIDLGGVWSDAYFTSPAVQAALDSFWDNAPAPDGVGLQDHYARAWQALAARYAGDPAVIGYDLMNEPFPGSAAAPSQLMLFEKGAELLRQLEGQGAPSAEELAAQWLDPPQRASILARLRDASLFAQVVDVTQPVYNAFERGALMGLYRRLARAIRAVDPRKILFLETSMGSNMGVTSAIEPLDAPDGSREPQQAYAPHGYDLVVDTADVGSASPERVELIFTRHAETARRRNWPMLVGEWGAFGDLPGTLPAAQQVGRLFEHLLCSDTYWAYQPGLAEFACFPALWRPYPERIAGVLEEYRFDPQSAAFECAWQEDPAVSAPGVIYLPAHLGTAHRRVVLEPFGEGFNLHPAGSAGAWLHIPPTGMGKRRRLVLAGA